MKRLNDWMIAQFFAAALWCDGKKEEIKEEIKAEDGAMYSDTIIKIIMGIVIGGLILGALYWAFKDTLIPVIVDKLKEMFNPPARP